MSSTTESEVPTSDIMKENVTSEDEPVLSKNARKRLLKAEYREAKWAEKKKLKKEQKQIEKERRQLENAQKKDQYQPSIAEIERAAAKRISRKEEERKEFLTKCDNNFKVIIDCAFEDDHSENGLRSLTQQIMFAYGANKRSNAPCSMYITGLGDATWNQLGKTHPENWIGASLHREHYQDVVQDKKLVYLTADSPNTIASLDTNCAYIIGGIVDRNRLKNITYKKAVAENIETAKLPLDECIKMMGNNKTKVLTVNHVFEILLKFAESESWTNAFQDTLPGRKDVVVIQKSDDLKASSIADSAVKQTTGVTDDDGQKEGANVGIDKDENDEGEGRS